jgi:hypothetical protein
MSTTTDEEARALIALIRANKDEYLHGAAHKLADIAERLLAAPLAQPTPETEEAVVRKMVANISDRYLAKLSCGRNADDRREGAICHPREEHERVMVATFCGFLGFDVKDK